MSCRRISRKDDTDRVLDAIFDPNKTVIVQTAPSVRVALGDAFGMEKGSIVTKKMVTALRMIGFDKVFDTNYGADLTITEEANELMERIQSGQKMPMATSCCPGWVNYMEKIILIYSIIYLQQNLLCKFSQLLQNSLCKTRKS